MRVLILFLAFLANPRAAAETLTGRVVGVTEGDTISILLRVSTGFA